MAKGLGWLRWHLSCHEYICLFLASSRLRRSLRVLGNRYRYPAKVVLHCYTFARPSPSGVPWWQLSVRRYCRDKFDPFFSFGEGPRIGLHLGNVGSSSCSAPDFLRTLLEISNLVRLGRRLDPMERTIHFPKFSHVIHSRPSYWILFAIQTRGSWDVDLL